MKKINACINQKDRIVCEAIPGALVFYYQPARTNNRTELLRTKEFSPSVFKHFRKEGRNMSDRGFSITIKQLYEFRAYHNPKLSSIIDRLPGQIEYAIRERSKPQPKKKTGNLKLMVPYVSKEIDREYAA